MKKLLISTALVAITTVAATSVQAQGVFACLSTKTDTNPFFVKMREGAEAAAAQAGITAVLCRPR